MTCRTSASAAATRAAGARGALSPPPRPPSEMMLREFPAVQHVYLASGSCLPLRPVEELVQYLQARPRTDFIESVTTRGRGLDRRRSGHRALHAAVSVFVSNAAAAVRRLCAASAQSCGLRRRIPSDIVPHLGSQWWCLTRQHAVGHSGRSGPQGA